MAWISEVRWTSQVLEPPWWLKLTHRGFGSSPVFPQSSKTRHQAPVSAEPGARGHRSGCFPLPATPSPSSGFCLLLCPLLSFQVHLSLLQTNPLFWNPRSPAARLANTSREQNQGDLAGETEATGSSGLPGQASTSFYPHIPVSAPGTHSTLRNPALIRALLHQAQSQGHLPACLPACPLGSTECREELRWTLTFSILPHRRLF